MRSATDIVVSQRGASHISQGARRFTAGRRKTAHCERHGMEIADSLENSLAEILHHGPPPAYARGRAAVAWRGGAVAAGAPRNLRGARAAAGL